VQALRLAFRLVTVGLLGLSLAACHDAATDNGCPEGTEGCACAPDGCGGGLACVDDRCVPSEPPDALLPDIALPEVSQPDLSSPEVSSPDSAGSTCATSPYGTLCPCRENADCASGFCVASPNGGSVCTTACEDTCPDGWDCRYVTLAGFDPTFLCVSPALNLCRPCVGDDECQRDALGASGSRCVSYGASVGSFCGVACTSDADCPDDYACRDMPMVGSGAFARQCALRDVAATCPCTGRAVEGSAWTSCGTEDCDGTRVCRPEGLTLCTSDAGVVCEPPVEVFVTFDPQGGVAPEPATRRYLFGRPYGVLPEATRAGYGLSGWWTAPSGGGARVEVTTFVDRREAFTLYAGWTARRYQVSFDSAGGSLCDPIEVTFATPYAAGGALCAPTRTGHVFGGWTLGEGGAPVDGDTLVATPSSHVLHARWTAERYTVRFDSEGGTACPALVVGYGATYGASGPLCEPTRAGYSFAGWHEGDNGTGARVTASSVVGVTADHALFARWTPNTYAVTFDAGDGTAPSPPGKTVTFGGLYGALATSTRAGYALVGWWTGPGGAGVEVAAQTEVTRAEDHVLYANWRGATFMVSFDSEGGSPCDAREVVHGDRYGPLCSPTRAGFTFAGWHAGDDGVGARVVADSVVTAVGDHTLHARWTANRYTVSFDSEGGAPCDSVTVTFRQAYGAAGPLCAPTRAGHVFAGWYDGDNGTGTQVTDATVVTTASSHTLHARWTVGSWTVSFEAAGGSACAAKTVTYGQPYGGLCVSTRAGYAFEGWYAAPGGAGGRVLATTVVTALGDHVLYAHWSVTTLTVTYDNGGGAGCATLNATYGSPYGAEAPGGALCVPTRAGYAFGGWYEGAGGTGARVTAATVVAVEGPHTLYARWTANSYAVRFESGGGTACAGRTVTYGAPYGGSGPLCEPTREGYRFGGWWTGVGGTGGEVTASTVVATSQDHALYARWTANTYQISYDSEGGSACAPRSVSFGSAYGPLCTPVRSGFGFDGWWTGDDGTGTAVTAQTDVTTAGPHTLHARWMANAVTVSHDSEGGSACDAFAASFGAPYGARGPLCVPVRAGYVFGGWWTQDGGTGSEVRAETLVATAGNHTLYARWTASAYAVTYDSEGGTACAGFTVIFGATYGNFGALCAPTRTGHTFGGWWTGDGGTGASVTATTAVTATADHTLYARWTVDSYTVSYDAAGGTSCGGKSVTFGAAYGALCATTRTGFTFGGWWTGPGGAGAAVTADTIVGTAGNHTLYARWTANNYTIGFDSEGGSACDAVTVTFGQAYAPGGVLCAPTRTGHTFGGWFMGDNGTGSQVFASTVVATSSDHTLYARWTANVYTVTFLAPDGSTPSPRTSLVTFGATYGALATSARTGYSLVGWWTEAGEAGTQVVANTPVSRTEDHALHARWQGNAITVSYDSEGGSGCASRAVTFGSPYGAHCAPTRVGYTFGGWWTGDNGTGSEVRADAVVANASNHTLYARWTANTWTVTLDSEGGTACAPLTVTFGAAYAPSGTLCAPTRVGYTFAGWWTGDDGTGSQRVASTIVSTDADHTLYARWTAGTFTVSFDGQGGSACASRNVTFGSAYGALCTPTRAGFAFAGWRTGVNGTGDLVTAETVVSRAENHTLYARWTTNTYSVTFDSEGGTACEGLTVTFGQSYLASGSLCAPTRVGYTFAGWWTGDNGTGSQVTAATTVTTAADHVLYARWTGNPFTVTFVAPDGTTPSPGTKTVTFGAAYGALATSSRTGYSLLGWWTEAGEAGAQVTTNTTVARAEDHALHARWQGSAYTVFYDSEGGSSCQQTAVVYGAAYGALCAPTRTGYTFAGWWTGDNGTGSEVRAETVVTTAGSHWVYARWTPLTFTVTFDSEGGSACAARVVTFGAAYNAGGALCAPTRTGYAFGGWWFGDDGTGSQLWEGSAVSTARDHALYARWVPASYTLSFDSEGGSACSARSVTYLARYDAGGALCVPTRAGFTFGGWWTGNNGTGDAVTGATTVTRTEHHTLHARWTAAISDGFVRIEAGSFTAGSPATEAGRDPYEQQVGVTITRAFELSETEITQGQWKALSGGQNPTSDVGCGDSCPVDRVSWWSALAYANALSVQRGFTPCYNLGSCPFAWNWGAGNLDCSGVGGHPPTAARMAQECTGYRLPTEAEWEYAARADTTTATWLGDVSGDVSDCALLQPHLDPIAWWACNADRLKPVKGKLPNPWGLHDMLGNVGEWTWDAFDGLRVEAGSDPLRLSARGRFELSVVGDVNRTKRVVRGGDSVSGLVRAARRDARLPSGWAGLRLARTLSDEQRPRFVFVNHGASTLGSPAGELGRQASETQAAATVTRHFELSETEITQGQWKALSGGVNPSYFQSPGCVLDACTSTENENDLAPVERVSWWSGLAYANALSEAVGLAPCYVLPSTRMDGSPCAGSWQAGTLDCGAQWPGVASGDVQACDGYRMPTEAEWEFAARAGTATATPAGDLVEGFSNCMTPQSALNNLAWWCGNAQNRAWGVRSKGANPWDLFDLHGNVWEWVWDAWDAAGPLGGTDPQRATPGAPQRVRRGGSWLNGAAFARSAARVGEAPSGGRDAFVGLRLARTSPQQETWLTVTYDSEGGSACAPGTFSVRTDETYGARGALCAPTRDGWAFEGWWSGDGGTGAQVTAQTLVGPGPSRILHARWRFIPPPTVAIAPGTFLAGSLSTENGRQIDEQQVEVTLTRAFELGTTEVTARLWRLLGGSPYPASWCVTNGSDAACPVNNITWWSALGFLNALSQVLGLTPCYVLPASGCTGTWQDGSLACGDRMPAVVGGNVYACEGYRLPTEAEWEYAARAGTTTATYAGDLGSLDCPVTLGGAGAFPAGTPFAAIAWLVCEPPANHAREVGLKAPNAWGLHDMLGNRAEWTWDRYHVSGPAGGLDPQRTDAGEHRVARGGGHWHTTSIVYHRSASRSFSRSPDRTAFQLEMGLRVARTLPPAP
jgi:uncharacterized repeat protein (TIGR02543 family)